MQRPATGQSVESKRYFETALCNLDGKIAELEVDHYSIPSFDEFGLPSREDGVTIGSNKTLLKGGEILYSKLNCHKPRVWLVPYDEQVKVASTEFIPLTEWFAGSVDKRFVSYLLGSRTFAEYMTCFQTSVTNSHRRISPNDLWDTRLPFPAYEEQQRIAVYLDASCASIDAAVNAKRRQLEIIDSVKESMVEFAVIRGIRTKVRSRAIHKDWIGVIPEHWEVSRIKRVVSRVDYGISARTEPDGKYPVLKMGNIQNGEIVSSNIEFVDEVPEELLLEGGDLLYNRTNSPDQVGKAAIFRGSIGDRITFASYLVRLRINHRADSGFLNYQLNSRGFLSFARKLAIPSVQQANLNSTRYCRMLIPRPPKKEQKAIAEFLDERIAEINQLVGGIQAQIETLNAYRKSLVHERVTGQRRITDADLKRVGADV